MTTENTSHTPGAIRAATEIWDIDNKRPIPDYIVDSWAAIIDRETAAPALLEACKPFDEPYGYELSHIGVKALADLRAAITKAKGGAA